MDSPLRRSRRLGGLEPAPPDKAASAPRVPRALVGVGTEPEPTTRPGAPRSSREPEPNPGPPGPRPEPNPGPPGHHPEPNPGPPGHQPELNPGPPGQQPDPNPGPPGPQPEPNPGPPGHQPEPNPGPPGHQPEPSPGPPGHQPEPSPGPPGPQPRQRPPGSCARAPQPQQGPCVESPQRPPGPSPAGRAEPELGPGFPRHRPEPPTRDAATSLGGRKRAAEKLEEAAAPAIPKGRPKSGRVWKDRAKKRFSLMVQDKPLRTSWQRKMKERQERKAVRDFARHLAQEKAQRREEKKQRRAENLRRRLENEQRAEVVQVIRNPAKLKRARKQHLRSVQKRDTLLTLQKRPPQQLQAEAARGPP